MIVLERYVTIVMQAMMRRDRALVSTVTRDLYVSHEYELDIFQINLVQLYITDISYCHHYLWTWMEKILKAKYDRCRGCDNNFLKSFFINLVTYLFPIYYFRVSKFTITNQIALHLYIYNINQIKKRFQKDQKRIKTMNYKKVYKI